MTVIRDVAAWSPAVLFTAVVALSLSIYSIAICVRRIFFHPLSHIPGPFLAKITDAYSAYYSYRGDMHLHIGKCHQRYGDVIRYGPNRVLSLAPQDINAVYGYGKPFRKAQSYAHMVPWEDGWSTATCIDKQMHRNLRKNLVSGWDSTSLKQFEPAILKNIDVYFKQLLSGARSSDGWSETRDMRSWSKSAMNILHEWQADKDQDQWFALDTIAEYGFGVTTNLLGNSEDRFILDLIHMHTKKLGVYEQWPRLNRIGLGDTISRLLPTLPVLQKFAQWHSNFIQRVFEKNSCTASGIMGPMVMKGKKDPGPGKGHTEPQMVAEGSFVTLTGSDAIGNTLSGVQHYLTQYPEAHEKLKQELRSKFPKGEAVVWGPQLASCRYLRACLNESWRLLPPAGGVHWRESESIGTLIGDKEIPVGCDVGMSLYTVFRDERVFRDAIRFWPERWLEGTLSPEEYSLAKKTFIPFSIGPRACAGSQVAVIVSSISVANMIVNFDFQCLATQSKIGSDANVEGASNSMSDRDLQFEINFSLPSWEEGPLIQFRERQD